MVKVFHSLAELASENLDFGLALGVFDGVHLGHQAVIDGARGCDKLGVLTFEPHPIAVLAPERAPLRILANLAHKKLILERLGVDFVVEIEFTKEFAEIEARDFADQLFRSGAKKLSAGLDWSFGNRKQGGVARLREWGEEAGVEIVGVAPLMLDEERISSTRIRQCLRDNHLAGAAEMLGREYSVYGKVVKGKQLGRTLGVPTANVVIADEKLPESGVYVVEGNGIKGVANIGVRPTVDDSLRRTLELHLFSDDVPDRYGWDVEVCFLARLRDEVKFDSVELLREQVMKDIAMAKEWKKG